MIYAKSQIARYIPGNIFHIPARHIAGKDLGYDHGPLAVTTIYEITGVLFASSIIALVGYLSFSVHNPRVSLGLLILILMIAFLFPLAFNRGKHYIPFLNRQYVLCKTSLQFIRELLPIYLYYFCFFLFLGGIFLYVTDSFSTLSGFSKAGEIYTIFILAVMVGFITPGAPSGLGVREAIIVFSLGDLIGQNESIMLALFFRLVTIFGDFLLFLSPFVIKYFGGVRKLDS